MVQQVVVFSFVIITYNRKEKLLRLLNQFLDPRWEPIRRLGVQIIVADDHGTDNSYAHVQGTVQRLTELGFLMSYHYRETNLRGDKNLHRGYHEEALGEYAWLFCDDDQFDLDLAPGFISAVLAEQPAVALCGFGQGIDNAYGSHLEEFPTGKIVDPDTAIRALVNFPKTSAYIFRRDSTVTGQAVLENWGTTLFQWIGAAILLFAKHPSRGVYIDPRIIAFADEDFGHLRYSYRVFAPYADVVREALDHASLGHLWSSVRTRYFPRVLDPLTLAIAGLSSHYQGIRTYEEALKKREWRYLWQNCSKIPLRYSRIRATLGLVRALIHSWSKNHRDQGQPP